MYKIIQLSFILLILILLIPTPEAKAFCPPPSNLRCQEFQNSVGLTWSKPITYQNPYTGETYYLPDTPSYTVTWKRQNFTGTCTGSSPISDCGTTTLSSSLQSNITTLLPGLTQGQKYYFNIIANLNEDPGGNWDGCSGDPNNPASITCTPTICGDNAKGTNEICDGTDFGTQINSYTNQCGQHNSSFESGNLTCVNNSGVCQISTNSCVACNTISNPITSNGVNTSGLVAINSTFQCLVDASRVGPAIGCDVVKGYGNNPIIMSNCTYNSWQGSQAKFNCTAPSQPSTPGSGITTYFLRARYPIGGTGTSGSLTNSNCTLQTKTPDIPLNVINSDTTTPTVSVIESYSNYTNENPSTELKVTVGCNDSGSGCYLSSYKLKRFDTKPTSCPTTYADYNLTPPNSPDSSKSVWYCAAAQDNLGNTGFSTPFEIRPGCRDACQPDRNEKCQTNYYGGDDPLQDSYECRRSGDPDACYEWKYTSFCGEFCMYGECNTQVRSSGLKNTIGWGRTVDTQGKGLQNITIKIEAVYDTNLEEDFHSYTDMGDFILRPAEDSSDDGIYKGDYRIFTPSPPPPGYQLQSITCIEENGFNEGADCIVRIPFDQASNPTLSFVFSKTDNVFPNGTLTIPTRVYAQRQVTLGVSANDNIGIKDIELYIDNGLVKRCQITGTGIYTPLTSGDCSYNTTFLLEGDHSYYAKIYDTVGNKTAVGDTTVTGDTTPPNPLRFSVLASPPTDTTEGCGSTTNFDLARGSGLVSTPILSGKFNTTPDGACIINPKSAFTPAEIPLYDTLKSLYYNQKR